MAVLGVVPVEEESAVGAAIFDTSEAFGEVGSVLDVLKCASEYGLSLETWGRE